MRVPADPLAASRRGLILTAAATLAALAVLAVSYVSLLSVSTGANGRTGPWIRGLGLATPALVATGRPLRALDYTHPAVNLRHGPQLPMLPFSPESILLFRPAHGRKPVP